VDILSRPVICDFVPVNPQSPRAVPQGANNAAASNGANSDKPSLAEAIAAVARHFIVEVTNTPEIILEAQRLRYQVYCVERGYEGSVTLRAIGWLGHAACSLWGLEWNAVLGMWIGGYQRAA
jgi:hypothetical protein